MIFADKITALRKKNGWSQEELAEKMSVSRQAVSKWERELCYPDIFLLPAISDLIGISIDEMMKQVHTGTTVNCDKNV